MTVWDFREFNRRLAVAVDAHDRKQIEELCTQLVAHVHRSDELYPARQARAVLRHLRRKRYFDLMTTIADVLLQSGQRDPAVRCEYAQALTDRGMPGAAAELLRALVNESDDPAVHAEVLGMLGRAYKQMSLAAEVQGSARHRELLAAAVDAYGRTYRSDPAGCAWHGINAAALARYAERHDVDIGAPFDAGGVARSVFEDVESRYHDPEAPSGPWDAALAAEAGLILDMPEETVTWMQRYAADGRADAFELASTLRQLTEVWQLDASTEPGSRLLPIIRSQMMTREQGASLELTAVDAGSVATAEPDSDFEKVLGDAGVVTYSWYRQGLLRSRAVALLRHRSGRAVGTGFLVRGADLQERWSGYGTVLVTNSHVVSPEPFAADTLTPEQAVVSFQAVSVDVSPAESAVEEALWSSPPRELDCTVLRLSSEIEDIEPCPITPFRPRLDGKQRVYVIGHPEGRELSYSIDDNLLLDYDDSVIHYRAPTEHGSSGSPVFNRDWEVMGLHHAGRSDMRRLHGEAGTYPANEGIWIQAIRTAIGES
jgi:S1-C subfamily serine protease